MNNKAVALILVISLVLIVSVIATVAMKLVTSQAFFVSHQVHRLQAYYAGQAAIAFMYERLRTGQYVAGTNCQPVSGGCASDMDLSNFPTSIQQVVLFIDDSTYPVTIRAQVDYR